MVHANSTAKNYPCFSNKGLRSDALRLRLSSGCNLQCARCATATEQAVRRSLDRAGMTLMTEAGAFDLVRSRMEGKDRPAVVEIAGPGEPLLHAGTYMLMRQLNTAYPDLPVSLWTNGVLLPDRLKELVRSGLRSIVLTMNAVSQDTADRLYESVIYRARRYAGRDASHLILRQQWSGLANAVEAGIAVTVYGVRVPGINDHEIDRIESRARSLGVDQILIVDADL
ncbi:MAG: radical SAM protein [Nitrospirota bacterium]|nr:radical SAM protein [Nitrospirota bacterium]